MPRPTTRSALRSLSKPRLQFLVEHFGVDISPRSAAAKLVDALARSRKVSLPAVLGQLSRDELKQVCRDHQLDDGGRAKAAILARLLEAPAGAGADYASGAREVTVPRRMTAISRRSVLEVLTKARLLELARRFELDIAAARPKAQVVDALAGSKQVSLQQLLGAMQRDELGKICQALDLKVTGREKQVLCAAVRASSTLTKQCCVSCAGSTDPFGCPSRNRLPLALRQRIPRLEARVRGEPGVVVYGRQGYQHEFPGVPVDGLRGERVLTAQVREGLIGREAVVRPASRPLSSSSASTIIPPQLGQMQNKDIKQPVSINVSLDIDSAFALIEATFEQAKTAPTRIQDGGWTVERQGNRMVIYPTNPGDVLLDPLPDDYRPYLPETLGLRVESKALSGGVNVSIQIIRCRIGATIGAVGLDILVILGSQMPLLMTVMHGVELWKLRLSRQAATLRLLRLAVEALLPYELGSEQDPFR
jgi:hypothetical protein